MSTNRENFISSYARRLKTHSDANPGLYGSPASFIDLAESNTEKILECALKNSAGLSGREKSGTVNSLYALPSSSSKVIISSLGGEGRHPRESGVPLFSPPVGGPGAGSKIFQKRP